MSKNVIYIQVEKLLLENGGINLAIGDIIVGIDIGTSKVCTVVGEVNNFGQIEIICNTSYKCSGLKKGKIINEDDISLSIAKTIKDAEDETSLKINEIDSLSDIDTICFMGTNVVSGSAKGVVIKIGDATYFGKIAHTLTSYKPKTAFQKGIEDISRLLIRLMVIMILLLLQLLLVSLLFCFL